MPSPPRVILPSGSCYGANPSAPASRLHSAPVSRLAASCWKGADVGAAHAYRFLPLRLLMKDQFRSDLRIAGVTAPLLFLHGERDWVVPIALGERLYALANEPKQFMRFSDAGHEEVDIYGAQDAVRAFLVPLSPEAPHGSKPVAP